MFNAASSFHDQTVGEHEETKCVFRVLYQLHYLFLVVCTPAESTRALNSGQNFKLEPNHPMDESVTIATNYHCQ